MIIIKTINELKLKLAEIKKQSKSIGLVPTMGYLHKGHLSLVEEARKQTDFVIATIFVNPTQFAPNEDFNIYPRDMERDKSLLEQTGCDLLFAPEINEIYPEHYSTYVIVEKYSSILEGAIRPTHFRGVTTIVNKLFNLCQPDIAFFGQKDAQQAFIIKKMVQDLNMQVEIKIMPIIREEDGLAMSSRNVYLSKEEREEATILFKTLNLIKERFLQGEKNCSKLKEIGFEYFKNSRLAMPDYIEIVNYEEFSFPAEIEDDKKYYVLLAVRIGKVRLIDNIIIP